MHNFPYWENRKFYQQLMGKLMVSNSIKNSYKCGEHKNYTLKELLDKIQHEKLTELESFTILISDLFIDCDVVLRENYEISEEELRDCLKKTLLEIKNRYP